MVKYTEEQLAKAIADLLDIAMKEAPNETIALFEMHPVLEEIWCFGPRGPVGRGLGIYGGHAV